MTRQMDRHILHVQRDYDKEEKSKERKETPSVGQDGL
jgi:hypothetical protein